MENPLYVALSQQMALRRQLDVTAHNIANLNTVGYRAERPVFSSFVQPTASDVRSNFVIDRATYTVTREGALRETGSQFHLAIRGDGYFTVQGQDGPRYTRDGRFQTDDLGRLVTHSGKPVLDQGGGEILIPEDAARVDIAKDGTVSTTDQAGNPRILGQIGLVDFDNTQALMREEGGLYRAEEAPQLARDTQVIQGMVEESNVQAITEMTRLMEFSRAYSSTSKLIEGEHERQRDMLSTIGNPRV